jgi:hypothetical protein
MIQFLFLESFKFLLDLLELVLGISALFGTKMDVSDAFMSGQGISPDFGI